MATGITESKTLVTLTKDARVLVRVVHGKDILGETHIVLRAGEKITICRPPKRMIFRNSEYLATRIIRAGKDDENYFVLNEELHTKQEPPPQS